MFRRLLKLVIMIKNYTNAKSSIPNTLAKVVLELEQQKKQGILTFFKPMLVIVYRGNFVKR